MRISILVIIVCILIPAPSHSMKQEQLETAIRQGNWRFLKAEAKRAQQSRSRAPNSQDPENPIDWQAISLYASEQYRKAKQGNHCSPGTFFYGGLGLLFITSSVVLGAYNVGNDAYDLSQGQSATAVARVLPSQVAASVATMFTGFKFLYYAFVQRPRQQVQSAALVKATLQQYSPMSSQLGGFVKEVLQTRGGRTEHGLAVKKKRPKQPRTVQEVADEDLDCPSCVGWLVDAFAQRDTK